MKFVEYFYSLVKQIPESKVSSYGELARALGDIKASRAVGRMLNANPYAPVVACHRVVMSDGSIGGFGVQFLTYPRRHLAPHRVRVRLPTMLNVRYRYKENGVGTTFSPGYNIDHTTDSFWLMNLE